VKKIAALAIAVMLILLCAAPALALGISPPSIEFDVPAEGSAKVEFAVYDFTGDLQVSLEDIPLRVEPTTVSVAAGDEGTTVELTFYGDKSLGSKIYKGKIRFLAMTGGTVATGIKVRATVTNLVEGEPPVLALPEESQPTATTSTATNEPEAIAPPPAPTPKPAPTPEPATKELEPAAESKIEESKAEESKTEAISAPLPPRAPAPSTQNFPIIPVVGIIAGMVVVVTLIVVLVRRRA